MMNFQTEKISITLEEFALFRNYIKEHCGIAVSDQKVYLIESRLSFLVAESGCKSFKDFYLKVIANPNNGLRDKIIDAITTNETLWFRDNTPWAIMKDVLIPEFLEQIQGGARETIRIWSAACSTGQEPYSVALLFDEALKQKHSGITREKIEILATDISPSALFLATAGRYDQIAMSRGMEDKYRNSYFTQKGRVWEIDSNIRKWVSFKQFNLQNSFALLGKFDVIFCRNVAIYFADNFKKELFSRMAATLKPGGYFIIGSAESLTGYSTDFESLEYKRGIYYKLKGSNL